METTIAFFSEYKHLFVILHAISAAIGLGAATVSDVLFFRFLKDGNITNKETPILDTMTRIMWVAIFLLLLTGVFLFLSDPGTYMVSSKFLVKMGIVVVIALNGTVMTLYLHKHMQRLTFTNAYHRTVKRVAFASGAISIVSWYLSFILGSIRSIPLTVQSGLLIYIGLIVGAIVVSQIMFRYYQQKFLKQK